MNLIKTFFRGFAMGASDVVPGVSGGTIALIFGIYERLIAVVSSGAAVLIDAARLDFAGAWKRFKELDFAFALPLGLGLLVAVGSLASIIENLLVEQPERIAGFFFGLVLGSIYVAQKLLKHDKVSNLNLVLVAVLVGVAAFFLLGLQSGQIADPTLLMYFGAGLIAICAMILPGISGSFILLMMGMYAAVLDAVHDLEFLKLGVFAIGAIVGLSVFSKLLNRLLDSYHDLVMASLIGLMIGSLRVLWPFPNGVGIISEEEGESISGTALHAPSDDWPLVLGLGLVGLVLVVGVTTFASAERDVA